MKAQVFVKLKPSVLDPQGQAILHSVGSLGLDGVKEIRQGKVFEVELETSDRGQAEEILKALGEKLLANTVIENFTVQLESE